MEDMEDLHPCLSEGMPEEDLEPCPKGSTTCHCQTTIMTCPDHAFPLPASYSIVRKRDCHHVRICFVVPDLKKMYIRPSGAQVPDCRGYLGKASTEPPSI